MNPELNFEKVISEVKEKFSAYPNNTTDGIRVDLDKEWIHIRKSNTEPIVRIIAESNSVQRSEELIEVVGEILNRLNG